MGCHQRGGDVDEHDDSANLCGVPVRNWGPHISWDYSGYSAKMGDGVGGGRGHSQFLDGGGRRVGQGENEQSSHKFLY